MNTIKKTLMLGVVLCAHATSSFAGGSGTDNIYSWCKLAIRYLL